MERTYTRADMDDLEMEIEGFGMSRGRIREIREFMRMTQPFFAGFVGVAPATVYRWEAGKAMPSAKYHRGLLLMWERDMVAAAAKKKGKKKKSGK